MLSAIDFHTIGVVGKFLFDLFVSWDFVIAIVDVQMFLMPLSVFLWKHRIEHYYTLLHGDAFKGKETTIWYIVTKLGLAIVPVLGLLALIETITNYGVFFDEHIAYVT